MSEDHRMSFIEHLEELRKRLIRAVLAVVSGMLVCWFFREELLGLLLEPLYRAWAQVPGLPPPQPLNYTSLIEPFVVELKLAAIAGLFVAAPFVLYQLWAFISPGLYAKEKRLAVPFVLTSTLLFVGGSSLAYAIAFPVGFGYFLSFASGQETVPYEAVVRVTPPRVFEALPVPAFPPLTLSLDAAAKEIDAKLTAAPVLPRAFSTPLSSRPVASVAAPPSTAKKEAQEPAWWEQLASNLSAKDCGSLDAREDEFGVLLTVAWDSKRCGDAPKIGRVTVDGAARELTWERSDDAPQRTALMARDDRVRPGIHRYVVDLPKSRNAATLAPMLTIDGYVSLAILLLLAFGVVFELPVLITFLALAGIVNYKQLLGFSRYWVVIAFVIGAVLTPPDVISQLLMSIPLLLLYFVSILIAYFVGPRPV